MHQDSSWICRSVNQHRWVVSNALRNGCVPLLKGDVGWGGRDWLNGKSGQLGGMLNRVLLVQAAVKFNQRKYKEALAHYKVSAINLRQARTMSFFCNAPGLIQLRQCSSNTFAAASFPIWWRSPALVPDNCWTKLTPSQSELSINTALGRLAEYQLQSTANPNRVPTFSVRHTQHLDEFRSPYLGLQPSNSIAS